MMKYLFPRKAQNTKLMYIFKNLDLISSAVHEESIFVPNKGMVGPGFGNVLVRGRVLVVALYLVPKLVFYLELEQVVEVGSAFAGVAAEKVEAIAV